MARSVQLLSFGVASLIFVVSGVLAPVSAPTKAAFASPGVTLRVNNKIGMTAALGQRVMLEASTDRQLSSAIHLTIVATTTNRTIRDCTALRCAALVTVKTPKTYDFQAWVYDTRVPAGKPGRVLAWSSKVRVVWLNFGYPVVLNVKIPNVPGAGFGGGTKNATPGETGTIGFLPINKKIELTATTTAYVKAGTPYRLSIVELERNESTGWWTTKRALHGCWVSPCRATDVSATPVKRWFGAIAYDSSKPRNSAPSYLGYSAIVQITWREVGTWAVKLELIQGQENGPYEQYPFLNSVKVRATATSTGAGPYQIRIIETHKGLVKTVYGRAAPNTRVYDEEIRPWNSGSPSNGETTTLVAVIVVPGSSESEVARSTPLTISWL